MARGDWLVSRLWRHQHTIIKVYIHISIYIYLYIHTANTPTGSSALPKIVGGPASVGCMCHTHDTTPKLLCCYDDWADSTESVDQLLHAW